MTISKFIFLAVFLTAGLAHAETPQIPACLQAEIDAIKQHSCKELFVINQYTYQGKTIYSMEGDCSDPGLMDGGGGGFIDAECHSLCVRWGFLSGHGDGRCPAIDKEAVLVGEVWKDVR